MDYNLIQPNRRKHYFFILYIFLTISVFSYAEKRSDIPGHITVIQDNISLVIKNKPLKETFDQLSKITHYVFLYDADILESSPHVSVNITNGNIDAILRSLEKQTGFIFQKNDNTISVKKGSSSTSSAITVSLQGKEKRITGVVLDKSGEPIIGANIVETGTSIGTITDLNGQFSLTVASDAPTLQVSYIGYLTQNISTKGKSDFRVVLTEDSQNLDEVVVVGFGTQKKVNLTGAVTAVTGEEMTKRPVLNAESMLQGQIPGLRVVQSSGQPGNEDTSFRIRGQGTYSSAGSDPLILINGVPGSLSNLDPSVIESVSVLKDAASAAIYGSRAANGVVLVTTKKGSLSSTGQKFSASYAGNFSVYTPTKMLDIVTNSAQYMELFNLAKDNSGKPGRYSAEEIEKYRTGGGSDMYPDFDWVDYMFNPAFVQNHNISLNGNSDKITYNIALNFANQPGTMRGFDFKKYNATVDLASQLTNWLKVGTYITANYGDRTEPTNGAGDAFISTLSQAPTYKPWLPDDGTGMRRYTLMAYSGVEENNKNMPAIIGSDLNVNNRSYDLNGQLYLELTPIKGLKWHTKIAGRLYSNKKKDWTGTTVPLYNYRTGEYARNLEIKGNYILGMEVEDIRTQYTNLYSYLEYKIPFANENHNMTVMAGYNQEKETKELLWGKRRDYQFELPELDAGSTTDMENKGYTEEWALMSGFFRVNYDYKGIYLAEVNARYDGTSRIASDTRWGWFPSFSLGYRITEEEFMKDLNLDWLTSLKLRGSWGQLGNQNIGLYPYQALVELADSYSFDNSKLTQGVAQTTYVNRNLKWEKTTITDIGADLTLFNRLNIVFDWYKKSTTDILREAQLSDFIGLKPPTVNDGEMENKGIELALNWNDYIKEGFFKGLQYNAGFYLDRSRNKLVKFGADEKKDYTILREGTPYNSFYMLESIGVFATQEEIDHSPKQFSDNTKPGDLKYMDWNGDGKIDSDDRHVVDGRFPKFEYSFNAGVSWKGFDLSLMFQGVEGRSIYNPSGHGVTPFRQGSAPTKDYLEGMWTEENPYNAKYPRLYYGDMGGGDRNTRASTYYLRDASYLRLKNLTFGYTFPTELTKNIAVQKLRLFFSGDNLATITNYGGLDPERKEDGSFVAYPQNRIFSFGINVEF